MRIRFKPWARPELEASNFYRDNPEELKNNWINEFENQNNTIHLTHSFLSFLLLNLYVAFFLVQR